MWSACLSQSVTPIPSGSDPSSHNDSIVSSFLHHRLTVTLSSYYMSMMFRGLEGYVAEMYLSELIQP